MFGVKSNASLLRSPRVLAGGADNRRRRVLSRTPGWRRVQIQAVISGGDSQSTATSSPLDSKETNGSMPRGSIAGSGSDGEVIQAKAVLTIRKKMKENISEMLEDQWEYFINGVGQGIQIQLISEQIDPVTNSGKNVQSYARGWLPKPSNIPYIVDYSADFTVPSDFGSPGAVLITNLHSKEFHLLEIILHGFNEGPIFFPANTSIHSRNENPESRIIFKNQAYLPSQTPPGIKDLRREDLLSIRGTNQQKERKPHDRIYDYATYNDLGNPDKDEELARPVLGGHDERPYPRRCRTGRPPTRSDPLSESRIEKPHPIYVPRDETFEEIKQNTFSAGRLKALFHNLIPSLAATLSSSDIPFKCFSDIDKLYIDGVALRDEEHRGVMENLLVGKAMKQVLSAGERLLKYEIPAVIKGPLDIRANGKGEEFRRDYRNLRKALCVGYANQLAERKMHHNGYRTLGFQAQVVQVHPSSALSSDELGKFPDYVVYHELIATPRPYMRNVCSVEMRWVIPVINKLKTLDVYKLSGGVDNVEEESERNLPDLSKKEVEVTGAADDRESKIQAARERFLARKANK